MHDSLPALNQLKFKYMQRHTHTSILTRESRKQADIHTKMPTSVLCRGATEGVAQLRGVT